MPALPIKVGAPSSKSAHVWADFFLAPLLCVLVVLVSVVVPVRAHAQTNMTMQQLVPNLIRNISQTVTASSSGLTVLQAGEVDIGIGAMNTGNGIIGRVMINEARAVSMASIASRVVGYATPIALTMLAVDLISYGIKQCATSTTGWCGPQQSSNASNPAYDGYQWTDGAGIVGDGAYNTCQKSIAANSSWVFDSISQVNATTYGCYGYVKPATSGHALYTQVTRTASCTSGYVKSGSLCVVDPNAPQVSYTYPQLSSQLAQALSGNPNRSKDYWGIMPPSDWYAALGDPSTSAQPAQIVSPANGQVVGPRTTTTTSAGTTTTQQTATVSPNTDTGTLADHPVIVTTTTTTTNPDGTTTTTTTTQNPTAGGSAGGANPQPQPASSPVACGLGANGSPKCQIDETGTKQQADVDTAQQSQTSALTQAESGLEAAANSQLSQVDAQHQTNSAHFFTILNMMPSFGTETCTPPTINDTFNHVNITPAICDWYYAAKDIMSLVIAFGFMLGAVFMVKDTAQQTASS